MSELSPQEQFNLISNAIRSDDSTKLSELMKAEAPIEEAPVEEKPVEEPAATEDTDDNKQEEKQEETPPPEKAEDDASTPEEPKSEPTELEKLKEQLEKLGKENHALRSQAGRVPSIQRRLKDLDAKLEALEKARTSPSSQPSAKIQPKVQEMLKGIESTDPELAKTIADVIAAATNGVAEHTLTAQEEELRKTRDAEYAAYQEAEVSRLLEMYPNAAEVVKSPSWAEWKKEQPEGVVRLATSDNADEVSIAFQMYAEAMRRKYPEEQKVEEEKAPAAPIPDNKNEQAQQIEAERQRKLKTAAPVGSKNVAGKVELPDDPDALFKKFSEQIRKERLGG